MNLFVISHLILTIFLATVQSVASDFCPNTEANIRVHYSAKSIEENAMNEVQKKLPEISKAINGNEQKIRKKADLKKCDKAALKKPYDLALKEYEKKLRAITSWQNYERKKWRAQVEKAQKQIAQKNDRKIQALQQQITELSLKPYDINDPEWPEKIKAQQKAIVELNAEVQKLNLEQPEGEKYDYAKFEQALRDKVMRRREHVGAQKPDLTEYLKKAWQVCPTGLPHFLVENKYASSFEGLMPMASDVSVNTRLEDFNISDFNLDCHSNTSGTCHASVRVDRMNMLGAAQVVSNVEVDHDQKKSTPAQRIGAQRIFRLKAQEPFDIEFDIDLNGDSGIPTVRNNSFRSKNMGQSLKRELARVRASAHSTPASFIDIDDKLGVSTDALVNKLLANEMLDDQINEMFRAKLSQPISKAMQTTLEKKLEVFKQGQAEVPSFQSLMSSKQAEEMIAELREGGAAESVAEGRQSTGLDNQNKVKRKLNEKRIAQILDKKSDLWRHLANANKSNRDVLSADLKAALDDIRIQTQYKNLEMQVQAAQARLEAVTQKPYPTAVSSWQYRLSEASYNPKTKNYVMNYSGCPNKETGFLSKDTTKEPPQSCYANNDLVLQIDVDDMNSYLKSLSDAGYFNICDRYSKDGQCLSESKMKNPPLLKVNSETGEVRLIAAGIQNTQNFIVPIHTISDLEISAPLVRRDKASYLDETDIVTKVSEGRKVTIGGRLLGIPEGILPVIGWVFSTIKNGMHEDKLNALRPKITDSVNNMSDRYFFTKEIRVTPGTRTLNIYSDLVRDRRPKLELSEDAGPECHRSKAVELPPTATDLSRK